MGDMDYEYERAEQERKFQKFARENPDHPAVIRAIACRIASWKDREPSECEKEWLELALKEPNNPRVIRVRKVVAALANRPGSVDDFDWSFWWNMLDEIRNSDTAMREGVSQSLPTTVETGKAPLELPSPKRYASEIQCPMKTEHIDTSQLATILAALRFFQENHAFAVARYAKYHFEGQRALTVEEIENLCQTIITAAVSHIIKIVGGLVSLRPENAEDRSSHRPAAAPVTIPAENSELANPISDSVARALAQRRRDNEFRARDPEGWAEMVRRNTEAHRKAELKRRQAEPEAKPTPLPESDKPYPKLSETDKKIVYDDLVEHLRITKAFRLFGEKNSGNSTIN